MKYYTILIHNKSIRYKLLLSRGLAGFPLHVTKNA